MGPPEKSLDALARARGGVQLTQQEGSRKIRPGLTESFSPLIFDELGNPASAMTTRFLFNFAPTVPAASQAVLLEASSASPARAGANNYGTYAVRRTYTSPFISRRKSLQRFWEVVTSR